MAAVSATCFLLLCRFIGTAEAASLYASHYSGAVHTLSFTNTSSTAYTLSDAQSIKGGCGTLPAWLTYEPTTNSVYCSDEVFQGTGSVSSFSASADGRLTSSGKATALYGAVANTLYGGSDGRSFIASAHYNPSTITTIKLPLTSSSTTLQSFVFTMSQKGPVPSRQDAPHPHQVVVDPTGSFLLTPDLGADMIRVWSIDKSSGLLTLCPSLNVTAGNGPRHAAFWVPGTSSRIRRAARGTMLYVANELSNTISSYTVSYPSTGCLSFTPVQNLSPFPNNGAAPANTKVAEVHVKGNFLYSSNRGDGSFSGNDSMVSWSLSSSGAMTLSGFTSSYGTSPLTFSINKAGDFVAIGDQTTSNVAIVKRDVSTGQLGSVVASLRLDTAGTVGGEDGLSSIVWAE